MQQKLQLIAIKTKEKVFLSDNVKNNGYFHSTIGNYLIDGEHPQNTYKSDWWIVKDIPLKIEKEVPPAKTNIRYELKTGFPESELTPKVINSSYIDDESPYYEVQGLYEKKWDEIDAGFEDIEFELNVIEEREDFEIVQEKYPFKYNFLNILNVHPILRPNTPCSLSSQDSYKIIRQYVKENIDQRYAHISSDYDFHFEVKKKVKLHEPIRYEVNINSGYNRRKPKYETRYRNVREVSVLNLYTDSNSKYGGVPAPSFYGDNTNDLQEKVDAYLEELIEEINRPYKDCPHCGGDGVVLEGVE